LFSYTPHCPTGQREKRDWTGGLGDQLAYDEMLLTD
jgi:hypothetical protein